MPGDGAWPCGWQILVSNIVGERRGLSARQLGSRPEISALFLGDTSWLHVNYPGTDREGNKIGFSVPRVCEYLMDACRRAGMYGDHVIIRRPGVWAGDDGVPIAHCGDALFIDGQRYDAGIKIGAQIFAAAAREAYPASMPAPLGVAAAIQDDIRTLWSPRDDGADIIAVGLVGQAYLAGALSWRANGFLTGSGGSGKSLLLALLRAMTPLNHYSTDTSKAGIEGAVNGRAVPSFIDESSDRAKVLARPCCSMWCSPPVVAPALRGIVGRRKAACAASKWWAA